MEPAPELGDLPGATAEALREAIEPGEAITHIVPAIGCTIALTERRLIIVRDGAAFRPKTGVRRWNLDEDLTVRTGKQATTIEETSATMEQLAATVAQNANRAQDASLNAQSVTDTAEAGGKVMRAATDAMERITASSGKISSIIGMIDDHWDRNATSVFVQAEHWDEALKLSAAARNRLRAAAERASGS